MNSFKVLVLTDHIRHSDQNSIYAILQEMVKHPKCQSIDIASRGLKENNYFFEGMQRDGLLGTRVMDGFSYTEGGDSFKNELKKLRPKDYDILFLRLPRPITDEFLDWIQEVFSHAHIINNPKGIIKTSNKKYLINFPEVCPDIELCYSVEEVLAEAKKFPIVLKPLREYGGKGLLKIIGNVTNDGGNEHDTIEYLTKIKDELSQNGYLSMRYLKNVSQGDKRILVVNGEIMAASLRLPKEGSWLCNVAQGGTSVTTEVTKDEKYIIEKISPYLLKEGILIYGADTLVDDDGKRVLSEINTLSIGGFPQAQIQSGKPIIKMTIDKIFEYADECK